MFRPCSWGLFTFPNEQQYISNFPPQNFGTYTSKTKRESRHSSQKIPQKKKFLDKRSSMVDIMDPRSSLWACVKTLSPGMQGNMQLISCLWDLHHRQPLSHTCTDVCTYRMPRHKDIDKTDCDPTCRQREGREKDMLSVFLCARVSVNSSSVCLTHDSPPHTLTLFLLFSYSSLCDEQTQPKNCLLTWTKRLCSIPGRLQVCHNVKKDKKRNYQNVPDFIICARKNTVI